MAGNSDHDILTNTEAILDSISDGVFTVDREFRITMFNRAAEEITGVSKEEAVGKNCCDVFRASICETECALKLTWKTGKPVVNKSIYIIDSEGNRVPISISTAVIRDSKGNLTGGVETFRDLTLVEKLRKELAGKYTFSDIVSKSLLMQKIFEIMPQVSESDSTVLIEGESGTGKELFARAIHGLSQRKDKPFVAVNCGALPDTLLESELFGYMAGAFTHATKDKPGRFAVAEGGTIFLDEVGDMSKALQVRLLRVLQERTYEPLGGVETVTSDVRIVAATNKQLLKLVEEGSFRSDLFYRVNVVRIELPPLRKRREDIPLLMDHFINRFNRIQKKDVTGVSPEVMSIIVSYDFPGNVRELENIIEHAFVLCPGSIIGVEHLPEFLRADAQTEKPLESSVTNLRQVIKQAILSALKNNDWNRKAAADELGIHKSTLFRKIHSLEIKLPTFDGRSKRRDS